jgi:acetylornithine deacetylase
MNYMNFQEEINDSIALLQQLIAIPSFSKEEKTVADFLERFIEIKGYIALRKDNNVWMLSPSFDSNKPTILLNSHIDTVKPVGGWTRQPFSPIIEESKLFGLGSNDAGASVVSLLHTFFYLTKNQQTYNLIFAATAEEEVSGQNGIENILQELPKIDFAIVGEPTGMKLAIAEKGLMVLDCEVIGVAGHAARNEGENAIYKALKDIEWFRTYQFANKSELLGDVRMTVTQINAGTQHNVIPDKCTFVVDVRSNELYANQEILEEIKVHVNCNVQARSTRLSSTATPLEHPIVKRGIELGRSVFGSPTLSDQALIPYPSLKMGPGESARSHTADEYILLDEIGEAIEIYIQLLDGLEI